MRDAPGRFAAVIVGALVGALLVLAIDGWTRTPAPPPRGAPGMHVEPSVLPEPAAGRSSKILLVWASGGLPQGMEKALETMGGVRSATTVRAGLDWIDWSRLPDGTRVDSPPGALAIPWEVAFIERREYATFVPPGDRAAILGLEPGQALLADTSEELRGAGDGLQLRLQDRTVTVAGVISDVAANGYEAIMAGRTPRSWTRVDRFVLAELRRPRSRTNVERRARALLGPGQALRTRAHGETPFLRYGDAVLPQLLIKKSFGEFAARPLPSGMIEVDDRWRRRNIVAVRVPILGRVVCHRALIPQLRGALKDVLARGLASAINRSQFGGCYGPRFINADPGGRLSHHAWGIAIDLNVAENPFGTKADQDARLVEIMESWGFTWGGRWVVPDGMHFEWVRFP